MSTEYTPTTEDVTTAALAGGIYSEAEFDRWLAGEIRKAKADAWDEGLDAADEYTGSAWDGPNPYRWGAS